MRIPSTHHADLADHSYQNLEINPKSGKYEPITIDGVQYKPVEHIGAGERESGYQGTIYQRMDTGEVVVAHRGTEFDKQPIKDGVIADGQMVARQVNPQIPDALELTGRAQKYAQEWARKNGTSVPEITVTGHSLGGALAQATAYYYGLRGETFNAYGAAGLTVGGKVVPAHGGDSHITSHVMATDPVSAGNAHFGKVKVYATQEEVTYLNGKGGYRSGDVSPGNALTTAYDIGFDRHRIRYFSRLSLDNGQPHPYSVLEDSQALQRAQQNVEPIDHYRVDIHDHRKGITQGAQLGGALGAAVGYAASTPQRSASMAMDAAGDVARVTADIQGKAVQYAGEAQGIIQSEGARFAGKTVARGQEGLGEVSATFQEWKGAAQNFGKQGVAGMVQGAATIFPEQHRRGMEQYAEGMAQSGRQDQARAQAEAQATRQHSRNDAQQTIRQTQELGDSITARSRESSRQAGQHVANIGIGVNDALDRGARIPKQSADSITQSTRVVGEVLGGTEAAVRNAAVRQAMDPEDTTQRVHKVMKSLLPEQESPRTAPAKPQPLSYLETDHPDHALFQRVRRELPAHVSDEHVAELTLTAKRGLISNAERVIEVGFNNNNAYVYGPIGTASAAIDLRASAPPLSETMQHAEKFEQEQVQRLARQQEQQQQNHERGSRSMA